MAFKFIPFTWEGTEKTIPITTKITVRKQVLQIYNQMGRQARERYNTEINKFFEKYHDVFVQIKTGESLEGIGTEDDLLVYLRGQLILVSGFHIATHFIDVQPYSCKICGEEFSAPTGFHFDAPIVRVFLQHTRDLCCPLYCLCEEVGVFDNSFFDRENRSAPQDAQALANMPRLVDYSDSDEDNE